MNLLQWFESINSFYFFYDALICFYFSSAHLKITYSISGLCRRQQSNVTDSRFLCRRCLHFCRRESSFKEHLERCSKHDAQKTIYPKKGCEKGTDKVKFRSIERQLPLPFYFTADFECILKKTDQPPENVVVNDKCCCGQEKPTLNCFNCNQFKYCSQLCKETDYENHKQFCIEASKKTNVSGTIALNEHIPCGASYKISCTDPDFYRDPVLIGPDAAGEGRRGVAEEFLDSILHDAQELRKILAYKMPMTPLTQSQKAAYDALHVKCHICKHVSITLSYFTQNYEIYLLIFTK